MLASVYLRKPNFLFMELFACICADAVSTIHDIWQNHHKKLIKNIREIIL